MMIPDFNLQALAFEQGGNVAQASFLARIDKHKAVNFSPGDFGRFHKIVALPVQIVVNLLQAFFLGAGKQQDIVVMQAPRGEHGGKGIEIGIGVCCDEGAHVLLRGWN